MKRRLKIGDFVCGYEPLIRGIIIEAHGEESRNMFSVMWLVNWQQTVTRESEASLLNCLDRAGLLE
jgi:hypothetical protein